MNPQLHIYVDGDINVGWKLKSLLGNGLLAVNSLVLIQNYLSFSIHCEAGLQIAKVTSGHISPLVDSSSNSSFQLVGLWP